MNKTPRLSKSGIEYLDYQWGIWSGCLNWQNGICPVRNCWAKGIATRFHSLYPNGFEPTFYPEAIDSPKHLKKPSIIGVGWVGDVIGYGLAFQEEIYSTIEQCPQHSFLFLTKNPEDLINWSPFPDNCWVGVTATDNEYTSNALLHLIGVDARVKYLSFEPLLGSVNVSFNDNEIQWVIIGAQTKPYKPPKIEWVQEIVQACDKAGVLVFLKDNLEPILPQKLRPYYLPFYNTKIKMHDAYLRQEMPEGR